MTNTVPPNANLLSIPIRLLSSANLAESHWTRYRRNRTQSNLVRMYFNLMAKKPELPVCIILTRIAPRKLDSEDNLPYAFKHIKDCIADILVPGLKPGRADDNDQISWKYKHRKGAVREYGIEIGWN